MESTEDSVLRESREVGEAVGYVAVERAGIELGGDVKVATEEGHEFNRDGPVVAEVEGVTLGVA
jgi:hypothetical protein